MRQMTGTTLLLAAATLVGCSSLNPVQSDRAALSKAGDLPPTASPQAMGKPEIDPTYANGETVYMIGPHVIPNAIATMPNAYAHAEELYLVVYPQENLPQPGDGPVTLPSGYMPQCDPCFHPGLPAPFVYHDHVITGAPGMGNNGTAGAYKAPWKIIILMYRADYVSSPTFTPIKSAADLDLAEKAGNVFVPLNPDGDNIYEIDTGNLLICPTVSKHA